MEGQFGDHDKLLWVVGVIDGVSRYLSTNEHE